MLVWHDIVADPGIFELSSERPGLGITLSEDCLAAHGFELKIPSLGSSSL
jgi:L-alanine-DL-glutamate epimerase-like enolase superfamily enzyme